MGLKHGSSAKLELPELIQLVKAFEKQNGVELTFDGQIVDGYGQLDFRWTVWAWRGEPKQPGVALLGSASALCLGRRMVSMEDVLLNLLYAVDFVLAEKAFRESSGIKA